MAITTVRTATTSVTPSAVTLASSSLPLGRNASSSAPSAGMAMSAVSMSDPHQEQGADDERGTDEHGQCVRPTHPRRPPPQPSRRAAHEGGDAVDDPVDAAAVEV